MSEECIVSVFAGDYCQDRNNWSTSFHFAQTGQKFFQDPFPTLAGWSFQHVPGAMSKRHNLDLLI